MSASQGSTWGDIPSHDDSPGSSVSRQDQAKLPLLSQQIEKKELNSRIENQLRILRHNSNYSQDGEPTCASMVFKKRRHRRSRSRFSSISAELRGDTIFYGGSSIARSKGQLVVTYVARQVLEDADELALAQADEDAPVSRTRLCVFTPSASYLLGFASDNEADMWADALQGVLNRKFSQEQLEEKGRAFKALMPLLRDQERLQLECYKHLMSILDELGMAVRVSEPKIMEGHVKLQRAGCSGLVWKRCYFRLRKKYLYYYDATDRSLPKAVISLKFITSVGFVDAPSDQPGQRDVSPAQKAAGGAQTEAQDVVDEYGEALTPKPETKHVHKQEKRVSRRIFRIQTPLREYILKARHDVAAEEWISSIVRTAALTSSRPSSPSAGRVPVSPPNGSVDKSDAVPIEGKAYISVMLNGKEKKIKLSRTSSNSIGRSSMNTVCLADTKISRNHCKLEFIEGSYLQFVDMGSSRGSHVNGVKTTRALLKPGDLIKIGELVLTVKVEKK